MEMLAILLERYNSHLILNNHAIANVTEAVFYEAFHKKPETECVYLVDLKSCQEYSFLQENANFLVIGGDKFQINKYIGTSTNALLISPDTATITLYGMVRKYCQAFQAFKEHAFELLGSIVDAHGPEGFIEQAASLFQSPLLLLDENLQILFSSSLIPTPNESWNDFAYSGKVIPAEERPEEFQFFRITDFDFIENMCPHLYGKSGQDCWMTMKISAGCGRYYIMSTAECNEAFTEYHQALFLYYGEVIEKYIKRQTHFHMHKESAASFFANVIAGNDLDNESIIENAVNCGLDFHGRNYMAVLVNKKCTSTELMRTSNLIRELSGFTSFIYKSDIILLCLGKDISYDFTDAVRKLLARSDFNNWSAGIGYYLISALDLKNAYEQCRFSEHYGSLFLPAQRIYDYAAYNCCHMLVSAAGQLDMTLFRHPAAQEIMHYDTQNNTEYAITLFHYIRCFKNTSRTAKQLHVHRNTVNYRIERATELFHLDMEDDEFLGNLRMSLEMIIYAESGDA